MKTISRSEAKSAGLKRYFTGKECPNGHVSERYVSTFACIDCLEKSKNKYRSVEKNRQKEIEYKKKYRKENRDAVLDYAKRYWRESPKARETNKKSKAKRRMEISRYNSDYYQKNRDYMIKRNRDKYPRYKDYFLAKNRERRAKLMECDGTHTKEDVENILISQSWRCVYCSCDLNDSGHHVDHIIPLSKGGGNGIENIQCLCPSCNLRKSDRLPEEWVKIMNAVKGEHNDAQ